MTVHYCDRCGIHTTIPVILRYDGMVKQSGATQEIGKIVSDGLIKYELCPECMKEFYDFVSGAATQTVLPKCYKASDFFAETEWVEDDNEPRQTD